MRSSHLFQAALLLTLICGPAYGYRWQNATTESPVQNTPATAGPDVQPGAGTSASGLLSTSLDTVQKTVGGLALERWKKGNVREEAGANVKSIQRDLQSTLPGLLTTADATPHAISKVLPVLRNVDALYAVLLRVVDAARISAPDDQFNQLQSAMAGLDKARQALNDHIQEMAAAEEKQVVDLQVAIKAQPAPVCPVAPSPAPAPAPAKKVVRKKKPAVKPAAPAANGAAKQQ